MDLATSLEAVTEVILISAATASISFVVSESVLFRPVRLLAARCCPMLGKLLSCGFCLGYWVAAAFELLYWPRLFSCWDPLDYGVTVAVVAWFSGLQWATMCALLKDR